MSTAGTVTPISDSETSAPEEEPVGQSVGDDYGSHRADPDDGDAVADVGRVGNDTDTTVVPPVASDADDPWTVGPLAAPTAVIPPITSAVGDGSTEHVGVDSADRDSDMDPATDDADAVADVMDVSDAPTPTMRSRRPLIVALCVLLIVLLVAGGVVVWRVAVNRRHERLMSECVDMVSTQIDAWDEAATASDNAADAANLTQDDVADTATVDTLGALLDDMPQEPSTTAVKACPTSDTDDQLAETTQQAETLTDSYRQWADDTNAAVDAVLASRDEKLLDDAKTALQDVVDEATDLLESSKGNVEDDTTRTTLNDAITDAQTVLDDDTVTDPDAYVDAQATVEAAMTKVNDSVKAKQEADQAAEAQSQSSTGGGSSSGSSGNYSGSSGGSYSYGGYSGGSSNGGSSGGSSGSSGSSGGSSSGSSGGSSGGGSSAPSWSVPEPAGEGALTDTDPSL